MVCGWEFSHQSCCLLNTGLCCSSLVLALCVQSQVQFERNPGGTTGLWRGQRTNILGEKVLMAKTYQNRFFPFRIAFLQRTGNSDGTLKIGLIVFWLRFLSEFSREELMKPDQFNCISKAWNSQKTGSHVWTTKNVFFPVSLLLNLSQG